MQLGFFSFAKLLMLRDLDPYVWGEEGLEKSALIEGLLRSGFESEQPLFGKEDRLDEILDPADLIQVVDADASQTKVIEEVRTGRNLVVQGPPGTGKSQTITNIIAAIFFLILGGVTYHRTIPLPPGQRKRSGERLAIACSPTPPPAPVH